MRVFVSVCVPKQLCLWLSRLLNLLLPWLHAASTANLPQFSYCCCCSISWKSCLCCCPYGISHSHSIAVTVTVQVLMHSLSLSLTLCYTKTCNVFLFFSAFCLFSVFTCLCFMLFINAILLLLFLIVRPQQASVNFRKFSELFFIYVYATCNVFLFLFLLLSVKRACDLKSVLRGSASSSPSS